MQNATGHGAIVPLGFDATAEQKDPPTKPHSPEFPAPADTDTRRAKPAVVCYPVETLMQPDVPALRARRDRALHGTHLPRGIGCGRGSQTCGPWRQ